MGTSNEYIFINKCIQIIESRLGWIDNEGNWKNSDFENLSEAIFEKTKVSISVSTLKRIWRINSNYRSSHLNT